MKIIVFLLILLGVGTINSCNRTHEGRLLNESLRLDENQIKLCKDQALAGDAEAAKKLWHHYDFVALDVKEGEKWRAVYERLKQSISPTPAASAQ